MNILQVKKYYLLVRVKWRTSHILYTFFSRKSYWKTKKNDWRPTQNYFEALKVLKPTGNQQKPKLIDETFPKELENYEIKNEWDEIKRLEERINSNDFQ